MQNLSTFFKPLFLVAFLAIVFLTENLFAQLPLFNFETITSREGLPSNTILSATRDKNGFMWFGSRLCPFRYNGSSFQIFRSPETNFVDGIVADKLNNIWLTSDLGGVCKIENYTNKMVSLPQTREQGQTGSFFIDSQGRAWFSNHYGVNILDMETRKAKFYPLKETTYVWNKASFVEGKDNTIWIIGRDNGLFRYNEKKDTLECVLGADVENGDKKQDIVFSKGCVDKNGFLWLGTYNRGLIKFNPADNTYKEYALPRAGNLINVVTEGTDENGKTIFWIGDKEGVGIFRPDTEKFYFFSNIFPEGYEVFNIYKDPVNDIVWCCTSSGIIKYNPKSNLIQSIPLPEGLVPFPVTVNVILQDKTDSTGNTYYLGMSHTGIIKWDRKLNRFSLIKMASAAEIRWMIQRQNGTIWVGTNRWDYLRPGLFVLEPNKEKWIENKLSKLANTYFSVPFFMYGAFDEKDRLWIGNSDEGIRVLDEKRNIEVTAWNQNVQQELLKGNNLINDFVIDGIGNIWIATYKGILLADEKKKKFIYTDSVNVTKNVIVPTVNSLMVDSKGNIWGARWGGVTAMSSSGEIIASINTTDGFFDRESNGLLEDHAGNIWIGNYEGLYCYNLSRKRLIRFTVNDGLINNNTIDKLYKNKEGKELFIGQKNGFNLIKVEHLLKSWDAPTLAISSLKVHEKEKFQDISLPIKLNRNDNTFSVDFIALNYRKEQDNQYAYYLEGLDKKWIYSGSNHVAYYTNLNPGDYTLHLKAGDVFGNWNEKTLKLEIEILHAFYETWWFKTAIVLIVVLVLYMLYLYRVNQLLQLERVRTRISADLHDELGSSLSGISIMGTLAQNQMPATHPSTQFVERIVEETQHISSALDDIVWNISPKNDELTHLLARMRRYSSELFEAKQISYSLSIAEDLHEMKLSMNQRRDFYMIFKESVNNLVKYSRCKNAYVEVNVKHHNLVLTINDDGVGFDPDAESDRNGLKNLKARSLALKGKLCIDSQPGQGTTIILKFPLKG